MKSLSFGGSQVFRFSRSATLIFAFGGFLSACAGPGGLFCKAEHDEPAVARMMERSCGGERGASLQLGILFESRGDYEAAIKYYRAAAAITSGQSAIYVPPAGDVAGYVMPFDAGPREPGSAEAQFRLGLFYYEGKGVKQNTSKARRYFLLAEAQGHPGAKLWLSENPA